MPFTEKRPAEREKFAFNYKRLLPQDVTIQSAVWTVSVLEGVDAGAAGMISGAAVIEGDKVSQLVIDGLIDVQYCLQCEAFFSDGQRVILSDTLWVRAPCD